MNRDLELTIVENFVLNSKFAEAIIPYAKPEYFSDPSARVVFDEAVKYQEKYGALPSPDTLSILTDEIGGITQGEIENVRETISEIQRESRVGKHDLVWLIDETEKYWRKRACFLAVNQAIDVFSGDDTETPEGAVPDLLSEAVSLKFDRRLTHSFTDDYEEHYEEHYEKKVQKLPIHLDTFNKVMKGGPERQSLILFISNQTGGFKTGTMCDWAAGTWRMGYSSLYITLEMSEAKIRERIDANCLDMELDDLPKLSKDEYVARMKGLVERTSGRIEIKGWPEYSVHAGHFRYMLKELKRSKGFVPDFIFVDYLNLCNAQRLQGEKNVNDWKYAEVISKELRAISKEFNCCVVTATQSNRSGHKSTGDNFDLDQIGESYNVGFTGDFIAGIINTDELEEKDLLMFKQFKNRWAGKAELRKFVLGCRRAKMRLSDLVRAELPDTVVKENSPSTMLEKRAEQRDESAFDDWKI